MTTAPVESMNDPIPIIIAKHDALAGQFVAHFDDNPTHGFGGDLPAAAVRRLIEGEECEPGPYLVLCDANRAGSDWLRLKIEWAPPELLFPCLACEGRGEYVGLLERHVCPSCGGRKFVAV